MTKEELLEKANSLPLAPGVYLMHDKEGTVIYVGKAKRLKNRVSHHQPDLALQQLHGNVHPPLVLLPAHLRPAEPVAPAHVVIQTGPLPADVPGEGPAGPW